MYITGILKWINVEKHWFINYSLSELDCLGLLNLFSDHNNIASNLKKLVMNNFISSKWPAL